MVSDLNSEQFMSEEEAVAAAEEALQSVAEMVQQDEEGTHITNIKRLKDVKLVYKLLKYITSGKQLEIICELNKPYASIPFWSKYASDMIRRLQMHNFKWEDKPFEDLYREYPSCKSALRWWCNVHDGNTTQWSIERSPYLKEFLIENPPDFHISGMCCQYTKKTPIHRIIQNGKYDLSCVGIRKSEGGIRSMTYKSCFTEKAAIGTDVFRPIFWLRDSDKEEYCAHYGVTHSKCYTEYGLTRTGCVGCPFGRNIDSELSTLSRYEPKLYKAAIAVFGKSYDYTQAYMEYRKKKKEEEICARKYS